MIRTERLILRPWRATDREPFAAMNADPDVMRWFPYALDRAASDALAERISTHLDEHGWGLWALEVADTGEFAGFTGLAVPGFEADFTPAVEIGWRLPRWAWGRGYATEAARAGLAYAFGTLELDEVVSLTTTGNLLSRAVMERLGMTHDPADDFDHPMIERDHPMSRCVLYRLRRTDYEAQYAGG
ncbi:GNAT family N-acetyltransferase [Ammonicoccus fulvus]|uniref:GNAT family N-acetyltransferase n=1 Tax=Ammonicoccus fulvus TaxID=3138240 RepID=A0ABZ3FM59_9ACTN